MGLSVLKNGATMRLFGKIILATVAMSAALPVAAQSSQPMDKRVGQLESQMRAVQRKVFPGGDKRFFEPEFPATDPAVAAPVTGTPATSPIVDLTTRVDALERQLQTLTGQVEQATFKTRQTEEALAKFRADAEFRIAQLEGGAKPAADTAAAEVPIAKPPVKTPARLAAKPAAAAEETDGTTDALAAPPPAKPVEPSEAAYQAAYAFVASKQYDKAETALTAFVAKYPRAPKASHAQYWLGRTYMAQQLPAQAAKAYLDNYRNLPKGARAPDSLLGLGGALMAMDPPNPEKACEVYGELQAAYGTKLTADQLALLKRARTTAKCGA